ncbi:uncharacterized protein [Gossypium hirsutum]|uniref:Uncharacterized protein isoform X2 n=1 Tax=Gossypium hirsutum TaxID=3635 RepID=A0ABM3BVH3_GOSHI|nr:uncharacterized protein LOC107962632 isoform X2 [Gossypium hirsutum]
MRFKKGTKVEVLSKKEVPSGSWHCAEIISGNGHNYKVRYEAYSNAVDKTIVEMVSRKAVRPCPPALVVSDNWVPGDVVEVFDNFSWKMATILAILEKKYVLVRLLGSSLEFRVSKFYIRVRQSWQDNEWVVIGKVEAHAAAGQKLRAVERNERLYRLVAANPSVVEQVDAVAFPRDMLGEKYVHSSLNDKTGLSEVHGDWRKPNGAVGCYFAETNDADSVTCSVGSCSVSSNNFCRLPHCVSTGPIEVVDGQCSDAESFCPRGDEEGNCLLPTKEELAALIHKIKLRAYRCTLEALHASGPLSWEQEALVTNLRLSLHISNDEHLMELRNLISSDSNIPIR